MLRMGLKQVNQMDVGYVYAKEDRKAIEVNAWRVRSVNVDLYS